MKKCFIYIFILLMSSFLFSCKEVDLSHIKDGSVQKVEGRLAMVGNHPFEKIALHIKPDQQILLVFKTHEALEKAKTKLGKKVKVINYFHAGFLFYINVLTEGTTIAPFIYALF